ncbi:MAG: BsuBI/PstI family type II restriction endonuclease [Luteibacter sp.]|uniref:BsuBI/PstI family type II restriction endonuclease n=1 Tax=Luteibacter sp. TaxID=1886636 RepID=UPI00280717E7|nr:BsuBI/PstI family type II restriction endonuclease [Luteibacter sp.]MDQ7994595.1 BsuBI/PstI family type II restriction endonuclease [Luteibacter sp.]
MTLPAVPPLSLIAERLPIIFPEGTPHRGYVVREMSAKTIYVMFYVGAVVGAGQYIRPSQVTDMSDDQAAMLSDEERDAWTKRSLSAKKELPLKPWYKANSRESIRDETVRLGLIPLGAVTERTDVTTTSGSPRYAMAEDFLALFDTELSQDEVDGRIEKWRKAHLTQAALTRTHLVREGRSRSKDAVVVTFPNGETRTMKAGKSSIIAKAVIEEYATRFLKEPVVLWMSESGKKVVQQDDTLARQLKLHIDPSKALPDIILVDLGEQVDGSELLVVFVEVVASDGPVHEHRKKALTEIAIQAGFELTSLRFLTAFEDRSDSVFKKAVSELAWDTAAWFVSEPDNIILLEGVADE